MDMPNKSETVVRETSRKILIYGVLVSSIILGANPVKAAIIADGGFEIPALATDSAQYTPAGSIWQINGFAGIINPPASYPEGWFGPNAPEGVQYAFIQHYLGAAGSLSQQVILPTAGSFQLTFQEASRKYPWGGLSGESTYSVNWDGIPLLTRTTASGPFSDVNFLFNATAGAHEISFVSQLPRIKGGWDDETTFIDAVRLNPVPIPSAVWLLGSGIAGIVGLCRRKKQ